MSMKLSWSYRQGIEQFVSNKAETMFIKRQQKYTAYETIEGDIAKVFRLYQKGGVEDEEKAIVILFV